MKLILVILTLSALLATADHDFDSLYVTRKKLLFKKHVLTKEEFVEYASLSDVSHMRTAAQRMAIPRVVGSKNHAKVRDYVVESLKQLDWSVEVQSFHDETPIFGKLQFHNIIAKLNPNAEHYLMLACHYDSKYFDEFEFVGATDSAVPCAILLNLAHVFQKHLKALGHKSISLMLVFFDGEEAFLDWNDRDSIYGARHMAKTWKENEFLDKVDILMLLDLIGMPDPRFYSYFANTENWFSHLLDIEDRLADTGNLAQYASSGIVGYNQNRYFQEQHFGSAFVEDDHIPFLKRGVPILHLIPNPFPDCWHTPADNITMIDFVTTENIARIIRIFTIEYLLSESNYQFK